MDFDIAHTIFQRFEEIKSPMLSVLRDDIYKCAVRYSNIRAEWRFVEMNERKEKEKNRTISNNALIDASNILS